MSKRDKLEEWFIEERAYYKKWHMDTHKQICTILLTVSLAALGWFFSQWKEVGHINSFLAYLCVILVFIGFLVAILSNIFGLLYSAETAEKHILNLDQDYQENNTNTEIKDVNGAKITTQKTELFDKITMISFCIALISLVIFEIITLEIKPSPQ